MAHAALQTRQAALKGSRLGDFAIQYMAAGVIKLSALRAAAQFPPPVHVADACGLQLFLKGRLFVLGRKPRIRLRTSIGDSFYLEPFEQIKEVLDRVVRMSHTHQHTNIIAQKPQAREFPEDSRHE